MGIGLAALQTKYLVSTAICTHPTNIIGKHIRKGLNVFAHEWLTTVYLVFWSVNKEKVRFLFYFKKAPLGQFETNQTSTEKE